MKQLSILYFLLFFSGIYAQEAISFEDKLNFNQLLEKSKKEKKLIFVDAFASWCGPCKMMAKDVFTKKEVGDFYNANFINTKIDMEKGEGPALAKKYGVRAYPTYLFINEKGEVVNKALGYYEPTSFIEIGKASINPEMQVGNMKKKFEQGNSDPAFLMNLAKNVSNEDPDLVARISERYFTNKKNTDFTKEEVTLLLSGIKDLNSSNFKRFVENKNEISNILTPEKYNYLLQSIQQKSIIEKSLDSTTGKINEEVYLTEAQKIMSEEDAQRNLLRLKMQMYINDFPVFEKLAVEYYSQPQNFSGEELAAIANYFLQKTDNKESLKHALNWAIDACQQNTNYNNALLVAKTYQKLNDKTNTTNWAQKAIELSSKEEDVAEAKNLLK